MTNPEENEKATAVVEPGPAAAPQYATAKSSPGQKKGTAKAKQPAKPAAPDKQPKARKKATKPHRAQASAPRQGTKRAKILKMLGDAKGATLSQIMKATGWQAHSVRGFLSVAAKKHRIKIDSTRNASGDRVYRAAK